MKTKRFKRIIPIAAALILVLSVTVIAHAGMANNTFGLWLGQEKMELDEMSPVGFDLDKFKEHAEECRDEYGVDYVAHFVDSVAFAKTSGMTLAESGRIALIDISVDISDTYRTGHLSMDVLLKGETYPMNGMFLLEGNAETDYGYGVEARRANYVYEYAEGRKAYFVRETAFDKTMDVYFTENGVMYQLFVENSKAGREIGKQIVDCMAGVESAD